MDVANHMLGPAAPGVPPVPQTREQRIPHIDWVVDDLLTQAMAKVDAYEVSNSKFNPSWPRPQMNCLPWQVDENDKETFRFLQQCDKWEVCRLRLDSKTTLKRLPRQPPFLERDYKKEIEEDQRRKKEREISQEGRQVLQEEERQERG